MFSITLQEDVTKALILSSMSFVTTQDSQPNRRMVMITQCSLKQLFYFLFFLILSTIIRRHFTSTLVGTSRESNIFFHVCVLCVHLLARAWTEAITGSTNTRLRRKHRISVAFTWRHYQSASETRFSPAIFEIPSECNALFVSPCMILRIWFKV